MDLNLDTHEIGVMAAITAGLAGVFKWMLKRETKRIDDAVQRVDDHEARLVMMEGQTLKREDLDRTETKLAEQLRGIHADVVGRISELRSGIDAAHRRIDDVLRDKHG